MCTSSGRIAPLAEISGQWSTDVDRGLARPRHHDPRRVQQHRAARYAINAVAHDAPPESLACVRADLVRASRQGTKLDQGGPVANGKAPPARCRFEPMTIHGDLPPRALAR